MITKEQWYSNPGFQIELKDLLKHPTMVAALELVNSNAFKPLPTQIPNQNLIDYFAIMGAKKEGYNEFYMNLLVLAESPKPTAPAMKAWEYPKDVEELKRKIEEETNAKS
jgi:hypothetical protein